MPSYICGRCGLPSGMLGHHTSLCRFDLAKLNGRPLATAKGPAHFCCPGGCERNAPASPPPLWWSPTYGVLMAVEDPPEEPLLWVLNGGRTSLRRELGMGTEKNPGPPEDAVPLMPRTEGQRVSTDWYTREEDLARRVLDAWLVTEQAKRAYLNDVQYHDTIHLLTQFLTATDRTLATLGYSVREREDVLRHLLHKELAPPPPLPDAVIAAGRQARFAKHLDELRVPPPINPQGES